MTTAQPPAPLELDEGLRQRLAEFADVLIAGGAGLPSASEADVQGKWIDRTLAARPDLVEIVHAVIARPGDPKAELDQIKAQEPLLFDRFTHAIAGAYLMVPRVRKGLGLPGNAPKARPAYPDEAELYLEDGILDPVIERGPIYRPTPPA
ncbi:MAG: hypothetical protein QOE60_1050 [Thermoleophilaceae bacterium]|nr:hypothetical protein [Thermoleophilaceae bacterium]